MSLLPQGCNITEVERCCNQALLYYIDTRLPHLVSEYEDPTHFQLHILEVGCGNGAMGAMLMGLYKEKIIYTGIDPSPEAVAKAHARGVSNVICVAYEDYNTDHKYDMIIFTKSLHHMPSLAAAVQKSHSLLKTGGLLVADEFAREAADEATAKFVFEKYDQLEASGKFPTPPRHPVDPARKQDYMYRWTSSYLPSQVDNTKPQQYSHSQSNHGQQHSDSHSHEQQDQHGGCQHGHGRDIQHNNNNNNNEQHGHEHHHSGHECQHGHGRDIQQNNEQHSHDQHSHSHGHSHSQSGDEQHKHHHCGFGHSFPTSEEMLAELKKLFTSVEATQNSFFYHFVAQRYDNVPPSSAHAPVVKEFKAEEDQMIIEEKIQPLGTRFFAVK